tara:strand:- start:2585 stop:2878 length:294 start_codon:yes stop_codon:yes gene_type:complete
MVKFPRSGLQTDAKLLRLSGQEMVKNPDQLHCLPQCYICDSVTKFFRAIRDTTATVVAIVIRWLEFCLCFGHALVMTGEEKNPAHFMGGVSMIKVTL